MSREVRPTVGRPGVLIFVLATVQACASYEQPKWPDPKQCASDGVSVHLGMGITLVAGATVMGSGAAYALSSGTGKETATVVSTIALGAAVVGLAMAVDAVHRSTVDGCGTPRNASPPEETTPAPATTAPATTQEKEQASAPPPEKPQDKPQQKKKLK